MAGCTDIYPLHQTPALDGPLLDVTALAELRGISMADGWRRFGAATSWTDILRAELPAAYDGLKAAAREIGGVQIQASGTIGGNLGTASPAGDALPFLAALEADVELRSLAGTRCVPFLEFHTGVKRNDRRPDELIVSVVLPEHVPERQAFGKIGVRNAMVISMVSACVFRDEDGTTSVALGAVGPTMIRPRLAGPGDEPRDPL